ncbi:MAG: DUF1080 domain-containing protein [Planctomycetes bacterium]|nr:DUF1080 domain-containing protein [Planctomycetota bacterium]
MSRSHTLRRVAALTLVVLSAAGCAAHDDVTLVDDALADAVPPAARDADASLPPNTLSDAERASGWTLLFDGRSLDAWRNYKSDAISSGWAAQDGCLARVADGAGDIVTRDTYGDFELQVDWKIGEGGNSGIFFAVTEDPDAEYIFETGPEMQVLDNQGHANGLDPKTSAGSNYALHAPADDVTRPVGEFNHAYILRRGSHVEHWLNGTKLLEYELGSPEWQALVAASKFSQWPGYGVATVGHLALQDHGDAVWFRNLKVRRLDG